MKNLYHEGFTQNRELSNLRFNERILEEACDKSVPLLERLRFVSIFSSNLEEFFMVRVGSLVNSYESGDDSVDEASGLSAKEQLSHIGDYAEKLISLKDEITRSLMAELRENGIIEVKYRNLSDEDRARADYYFASEIRDKLEIVMLDGSMPEINQFESYFIVRLDTERYDRLALIRIPSELPAVFFINQNCFIKLENLIQARMHSLFVPFRLSEAVLFDITRNSEVDIDLSGDQLKDMKKVIRKRATRPADRLIMESRPGRVIYDYLTYNLDLRDDEVYITDTISYDFVDALIDHFKEIPGHKLTYEPATPFNVMSLRNGSIIDVLKKEELILRYPYDSMEPFIQLLEEAATDKRVREIRMTIYRLSSNPRIRELLIKAAGNGVRVRLLIELRARFDEAKNIRLAEDFIKAGCEVYYGNDEYKVHSKLCQIVLDEGRGDYYITHIGTGNFNEKTARQYTDFSLLTCDQRIGKDTSKLLLNCFKGKIGSYKHLSTSPENMYEMLIKYIRREADKKQNGRILIKCNSLNEINIMEELMLASCKGCRVTLLVRGICCLLPGIEDCTENIQIMNVVGRFLEHSRVYLFGTGSEEVMYISSADIMKRNLHRRIEVACPIYSKANRKKIKAVLALNVRDNVKGRLMKSDGTYCKKSDNGEKIDSQALLLKYSSIN